MEPSPSRTTSPRGVRGPRAPPERKLPRSFGSVSDIGRVARMNASSTPPAAPDTSTSFQTDSDIESSNLELPDNLRELRLHALERNNNPISDQTTSHPENPATDTFETSSDPGAPSALEDHTNLTSPRPLPALSIALPLPGLRPNRRNAPVASPRRSVTEPMPPHGTGINGDDEHEERENGDTLSPLPPTQLASESRGAEDEAEADANTQPDARPADHATLPETHIREAPAQGPPINDTSTITPSRPSAIDRAEAQLTMGPSRLPSTSPAAQRSRRRESRRRSSILQSNRRDPVLAALSSQTGAGPGTLLPSLYGYFSNEPAPSSLRPAAVAYGANVHGSFATVQGEGAISTSSGGMGRMNPGLTERILASGPSVSNLQPTDAKVMFSPGSESRIQSALVQETQIQPGSVSFPAGTISDLGPRAPEVRNAHVSQKFEQNSLLSLSWMIEDVRLLHEEITMGSKSSSGGHKSEAWNLQPLFGDERWRIELVRQRKTDLPTSPTPQRRASLHQKDYILTLKMTYLELMGLSFTAALPTHVMVGLRPAQRAVKQSQLVTHEFLWRDFFSFTFERNNDTLVFDRFPNLAQLMADAHVREYNAVDLVVQVGTGPSVLPAKDVHSNKEQGEMRMPFQTPGLVGLPPSLLQALSALVDDANTGDLMITVSEKGLEQHPSQELAESVGLTHFIQAWPAGMPMPFSEDGQLPPVFVRDRVLWAHSSILRERSEVFAAMIESNFSEGTLHDTHVHTGRSKDAWRRPYRMLRIPGADFVTMYWLLRYLYTDQVELLNTEDIQAVSLDDAWILGIESKSARPDWKWRSVEGLDEWDVDACYPMRQASKPILSEGYMSRDETRDAARRVNEFKPPNLSDPHPHPPMLPVPPASPLSLYRLAHRYHVTKLCDLITSHIISLLTPHNAINYLLLTALFEQLQQAIQNYISHHWQEVSRSEEFEYCCDQVSMGEWGPQAGRALASLMRKVSHVS